VSVVVPHWNSGRMLLDQLEALAPQVLAEHGEIIVVDDHSDDGTPHAVAAWADRRPEVPLTLLCADHRFGVNTSRNVGVAYARSAVVAFADGDDVVEEGWLCALLRRVEPGVIVSGRVLADGASAPESPGEFFGFGWTFAFGGSMALERDLVLAVDGFDENIHRGGTEVEFCLRAQLFASARVVVAPDAVVLYHVREQERMPRLRRRVQRQRGHAYIARKFRSHPQVTAGVLGFRHPLARIPRQFVRDLRRNPSAALGNVLLDLLLACWVVRFRISMPVERLGGSSGRHTIVVRSGPGEMRP